MAETEFLDLIWYYLVIIPWWCCITSPFFLQKSTVFINVSWFSMVFLRIWELVIICSSSLGTINGTLPAFFAPPKIDAHLRFDRTVGLTSFAIGRSGYRVCIFKSNQYDMDLWYAFFVIRNRISTEFLFLPQFRDFFSINNPRPKS